MSLQVLATKGGDEEDVTSIQSHSVSDQVSGRCQPNIVACNARFGAALLLQQPVLFSCALGLSWRCKCDLSGWTFFQWPCG